MRIDWLLLPIQIALGIALAGILQRVLAAIGLH
jgi:hypothetical protein